MTLCMPSLLDEPRDRRRLSLRGATMPAGAALDDGCRATAGAVHSLERSRAMVEPAIARMSVEEFLHWDPGGDRRYELIDGRPVAMAPPAAAHRIVAGRLARHIGAALDRRPPCTVQPEAGVRIPAKSYTFYEADLAVTCRPH